MFSSFKFNSKTIYSFISKIRITIADDFCSKHLPWFESILNSKDYSDWNKNLDWVLLVRINYIVILISKFI